MEVLMAEVLRVPDLLQRSQDLNCLLGGAFVPDMHEGRKPLPDRVGWRAAY